MSKKSPRLYLCVLSLIKLRRVYMKIKQMHTCEWFTVGWGHGNTLGYPGSKVTGIITSEESQRRASNPLL